MTKIEFSLRKWQAGDEASLSQNGDNYKIWINARDYFPYPYTLEKAYEWIAFAEAQEGNFAIVVNGKAVGGIAIVFQEDIRRKNVEIGYWLGENYWGKGISTEVVKQMVHYTFEKFPEIHRIYANVFSYNAASQRVLEKVGFRKEAVLKEAVFKADQFWDDYVFSLLRSEYKQS